MNEDVKAKWVAALRSGEYEQGRRRLRTGDTYCCLGVLCDLYVKETGWGKWLSAALEFAFTDWDEDIDGALPVKVQKWAGLDEQDPSVFLRDGRISPLSALNDGFRPQPKTNEGPRGLTPRSFAKIADLIEVQL